MFENKKIKQVMPLLEKVTLVIQVECEDGSLNYVDVTTQGWTVFYALVESDYGDYVQLYEVGRNEESVLCGSDVILVPTTNCNQCSKRMLPKKRKMG